MTQKSILPFALAVAFAPAAGFAQTGTQNVEVEPVTCWWRTSTSSMRAGQPFSLTLTCSALETEATKAVIDRSRLASTAVQLPPYEVIGGVQSEDVTTASRRFMQYEYTLRLIGDDVFGVDVPIPPLQVTYRIESKMQQNGSVQGREQTYVLPGLPIHVASLVPRSATHIREAPVESVASITARDTRGTLLRAVGLMLVALSGLLLLVSLVRAVQTRRSTVAKTRAHLLSDAAILRGVRRELLAVQQQGAREGWTLSLAARALAALRVTAAYAAGQTVAQRAVIDDGSHEGQLVLNRRWGLAAPVMVSGAATASDLRDGSNHGASEDLRSALDELTAMRYGRSAASDDGDLNAAVESGLRATGRVAANHTLLAETIRAAKRLVPGSRKGPWDR